MTGQHLVTTRAKVGTCPDCRRIVLAGVAEGLMVRLDPQPLNAHGELAARLAGRWTFDLSATGEIWYRCRFTITVRRHRVLADHECALPPPPPEHRDARIRGPAALADPDQPPY